jgi:hypothetical protein
VWSAQRTEMRVDATMNKARSSLDTESVWTRASSSRTAAARSPQVRGGFLEHGTIVVAQGCGPLSGPHSRWGRAGITR